MKTPDCSTFGVLIENHEPLELIDVRPKTEFAAVHIPAAHSVPLSGLSRFRTNLSPTEPVYVISDHRGSGSLAAEVLEASGDVDTVVIDGGMEEWLDRELPAHHPLVATAKVPTYLRALAVILALVCIGLASIRPMIATIVLLAAGGLLLRAQRLEKNIA